MRDYPVHGHGRSICTILILDCMIYIVKRPLHRCLVLKIDERKILKIIRVKDNLNDFIQKKYYI
jgi:hypothetical protein